ncbi:MAG: 4Fe-4S dicluster domain-containing protein, partial [Actinomycetota bacterium]|nr:4Fe-4S dicluster domain-containing protein [Actinomycetota bacterium]
AATVQLDEVKRLIGRHLGTVRTEFGQFGRQVSGYALEHLLPENGYDITRALVGSEGTLAVLTRASVRLVAEPSRRILVVLGFSDIASAGDVAPAVLEHRPTACEGLDARIVDTLRTRRGPSAVPPLPQGKAWLFVELTGEDPARLQQEGRRLVSSIAALDSLIVSDPAVIGPLWRIREDGAGLAGRSPSGRPAHSGWEDAAVPPEKLGSYLRDFDRLLDEHALTGMPFGHFGDGCVHVRLDMPLDQPEGTERFRRFLHDSATLVASYGGSLSGEHGDGRARSELLPLMYSEEALSAFAGLKHIFDPANILNPGVLVDPDPVDAHLRVPAAAPFRRNLAFAYEHDGGDFNQAVHRCTGVGKCRADTSHSGGVMCPSYLATKEEKDSTRGRARVLQEMLNGGHVTGGWRSPEVHEALDLCLSCKGCASDCPTGTDMATYKAEVLHQAYRRRLRPVSHYSLGWLPRWARLVSPIARLANALLSIRAVRSIALWSAGVDARRDLPTFAHETFRQWFDRTSTRRAGTGKPVLIFVDTFTNYFSPHVGRAAVAVLEDAGYAPELTDEQVCCGLTWISTGQLTAAKRKLSTTVDALAPAARAGVPIVGLEPSCTGVLRSDALELVGGDRARKVAATTRTLAELLTETPQWKPQLDISDAVVQPHCHHHAVMGFETDRALLISAGVDATVLGGCCGLAGNFGVEKGHYDVSVAVAEQQLLPALRGSGLDAPVLADGFSCRTQIDDLSERRGIHLAELLAQGIVSSADLD